MFVNHNCGINIDLLVYMASHLGVGKLRAGREGNRAGQEDIRVEQGSQAGEGIRLVGEGIRLLGEDSRPGG